MRSIAARRAQGERGTAIVEMAIVVPVFFLLIFGMMDFGWAFSIRENMIHSAQEGLRSALVAANANDQRCTALAGARQRMVGVIGATRAGAETLTGSPDPYSACTDPSADLTVTAVSAACGASGGTCLTVAMSYPYSQDTPIPIPGYSSLVPKTITVTVVQRTS
jgi:Flp pilus assembly protein TadG